MKELLDADLSAPAPADLAFTAGDLAAASDECRRRCESDGDARYCILREMLDDVTAWWHEYSESGGVPVAVLKEIVASVQDQLPTIMSATNATEAAEGAVALRNKVQDRLIGPNDERWH